jgi:hypothetical protein
MSRFNQMTWDQIDNSFGVKYNHINQILGQGIPYSLNYLYENRNYLDDSTKYKLERLFVWREGNNITSLQIVWEDEETVFSILVKCQIDIYVPFTEEYANIIIAQILNDDRNYSGEETDEELEVWQNDIENEVLGNVYAIQIEFEQKLRLLLNQIAQERQLYRLSYEKDIPYELTGHIEKFLGGKRKNKKSQKRKNKKRKNKTKGKKK